MKKEYYQFKSGVKEIGKLNLTYFPDLDETIKNEPMFWRSSVDFCLKNGKGLTTEFILFLTEKYPEVNKNEWLIDSRSHMLMKGFWPCIPGWHHDDVPRSEKTFGQPDYDDTEYFSEHVMCTIGESAMTEFISPGIGVSLHKVDIENGKNIYQEWNKTLDNMLVPNKDTFKVNSGSVYSFSWQDFHRGSQADKKCWRWFIRATRNSNLKHKNEIRNQVNVYMSDPYQGW